jgi:predicted dehydrogenase
MKSSASAVLEGTGGIAANAVDCVTAGPVEAVRVGILGCSDIARRKFIPSLRGSDVAELVAVASRERAKARSFLPGEECPAVTYEELLARPDVEMVYLSLPNHLHEEWAIRALEQGKHVICEKPLALSASSAGRMLAAAEANGQLLYENIMYLHHPRHAAVRKVVAAGGIGRIRTFRSVFAIPLPQPGNFRLDPGKGGGAFHDLARYPLTAALYFLQGSPGSFHGITLHRDGLVTAMHGVAAFPGDAAFTFSIAFGQQYESYYEIIGDEGKIRVDRAFTMPPDLAGRIEVLSRGGCTSITVPPADHFGLMIEHVCSLVRRKGSFREEHERTESIAHLAQEMAKGCNHGP